jgi:hypothetical protein
MLIHHHALSFTHLGQQELTNAFMTGLSRLPIKQALPQQKQNFTFGLFRQKLKEDKTPIRLFLFAHHGDMAGAGGCGGSKRGGSERGGRRCEVDLSRRL